MERDRDRCGRGKRWPVRRNSKVVCQDQRGERVTIAEKKSSTTLSKLKKKDGAEINHIQAKKNANTDKTAYGRIREQSSTRGSEYPAKETSSEKGGDTGETRYARIEKSNISYKA